MQQDADEFYSSLTHCIDRSLSASGGDRGVLSLQLEERYICTETDLEAPVVSQVLSNKIVCNIQGSAQGGSKGGVDHLQDGLRLWMEGSIEKNSAVLDRNAIWKKTVRISALPQVLCVQFMRFFWKATPESDTQAGAKCKILRPVSFQEVIF